MEQNAKPPSFSLRKNFRYMGMAFSSPNTLVERFREESSALYGLVPLAIFVGIYEILYFLEIMFRLYPETPFLRILPIPDSEYPVFMLFFAPIFNLVDYLVFAGVVHLYFQWFHIIKINIRKVVIFFMLIWNTIGLTAALGDLINFFWESWVFALIHPMTGVVFIAYVAAYLHTHVEISKGKAWGISITGVMAFAVPRVFFLV